MLMDEPSVSITNAAPPPHGRRLRMWRQWQDGTRCAANMAADGRRVVGGGRGTSCGTCEAVRAPQGRNLTVLHAAAAVESRENLLRRMPWHLCIKINPAIRLISSSCARPYLGRLYILQNTSLRWTEHFLPSRVGVTLLVKSF